jgi:hypothetical protein
MIALIQPIICGLIWACKAYYHIKLLSDFVNSELQVTKFLRKSALKDIAYNVGLACWQTNPAASENCWEKKYVGTDDVTQYDTMLAGFLEQEVRLLVMHSGVIYEQMAW